MKKQYNFQIKPHNDNRDWEQIEFFFKTYRKKASAIHYAHNLSIKFKAEIRLTEGKDPFSVSATYIREND
ncbi:addiction module toxin RelE [Chryseobacterium sp. 22543]|uniref:addiction module toxin RelE n=1 Tax=Chryseobacterium sp. 22543 TaxID=3453940 RepID=UPI003F86DDA9